jgi:hypothetical protein
VSATLHPTPERAEDALSRLTPAQLATFHSMLCSRHFEIVLDLARDAREYGQRRRVATS